MTKIVRAAYKQIMTLKEFMEANGLTDTEVAKAIKRTRATINRIRRGKQQPNWVTLWAIHKFTKGEVTAKDWL